MVSEIGVGRPFRQKPKGGNFIQIEERVSAKAGGNKRPGSFLRLLSGVYRESGRRVAEVGRVWIKINLL